MYVPAGLELSFQTRSRAAFLLVRDRGGVLGGYSAALLLGADCAPPDASVEVIVPIRMGARRGPRIRQDRLGVDEVTEANGCRVTTASRTAWDLARRVTLVEAVVAVDALARRGSFVPADLLDWRATRPGARGCRRLGRVVALADPRAESPPESRLRVGLVLAGLPAPEVQYGIVDEHGFALARADLAYPEAKLAIEYDGRTHLDPVQTERDRQRDAELAAHGWETLRLGRDQLYALPQTVQTIRTMLALRLPGGRGSPRRN
ncbi:MAG: DUF559 domain-containing protein [Actinobacteria bacterium]|nr:DUF559 domain-containing protein [Actinomycetota bacterium]